MITNFFMNFLIPNSRIIMLSSTYDWKHIEKRLLEMVRKQDKIFESFPFEIKSHDLR